MATHTLQVFFQLPIVIHDKGDHIVSGCPLLDVYSQGRDKSEAVDNLSEALQLFIETCYEMGTLQQVLNECGFKLSNRKRQKKRTGQEYLEKPLSLTMSEKNAQAFAH